MKILKQIEQVKPRSMVRVMSDIEFCITNDVDDEIIELDIIQLINQLTQLKSKLTNKEEAYNLINPAIKYYNK
jgi:hypothetical protein|tara:strand:- start:106 stop:324 length:219 start_codon:yes stop_codon:yes gene_type:complete